MRHQVGTLLDCKQGDGPAEADGCVCVCGVVAPCNVVQQPT